MLEAATNVLPNSNLDEHVFTTTVGPLQAFKGLLDRPRPDRDWTGATDDGNGDLPALADIDFEALLAGLEVPMWIGFPA